MKKIEVTTIDITWRSLFKIAVAFVIFYIVYLLHNIVVWIILALVISVLLNPLVALLEKRKIPRSAAAIIIYATLLLISSLMVYIIIPPMIAEINIFSSSFAQYFNKVPVFLSELGLDSFKSIASFSSGLNESLVKISSNILNVLVSLFGSILAGITIFILAMFMSIEKKEIIKGLKLISPKEFEEEVLQRWERSQDHVIAWFGSRVLSSVCVALMTFIMCVVLKIKLGLSLAILAGILNIIPTIGPLISGLIAALFALGVSFPNFILAVILMIIIQQIENNVLTPLFTKKMTGLPTILVLMSILIGGVLGGIIGAILAIPLAGIFFESLKDYFNKRKLS